MYNVYMYNNIYFILLKLYVHLINAIALNICSFKKVCLCKNLHLILYNSYIVHTYKEYVSIKKPTIVLYLLRSPYFLKV